MKPNDNERNEIAEWMAREAVGEERIRSNPKKATKLIKDVARTILNDDGFQQLMDSQPDEAILGLFNLGPTLGKPVFHRMLNARIKQLLATGRLREILDENGKIRPSKEALQEVEEVAAKWEAAGDYDSFGGKMPNADKWQEAQSYTLTAFAKRHQGELN